MNTIKPFSLSNWKLLLMIVVMVMLSGCAYPNELRKENQVNPGEFITVVQQAVDQFQKKTGLLPIKNSNMNTPLYEKYVIDFKKLQEKGLLSSIPMNAFENGGIFMYVLVNAETKPTVKLMDLAAYQSAVNVKRQVDEYHTKNKSYPVGVKVTEGYYYVDFDKLGKKKPEIKSTYQRQNFFHYIIREATGEIAIDYGPDLMKQIKSLDLAGALNPDQDLRMLLVDHSYFVPARSFEYRWKDNQPLPSE